jgi:hypothetical protein
VLLRAQRRSPTPRSERYGGHEFSLGAYKAHLERLFKKVCGGLGGWLTAVPQATQLTPRVVWKTTSGKQQTERCRQLGGNGIIKVMNSVAIEVARRFGKFAPND